jgi:hypothetical protein
MSTRYHISLARAWKGERDSMSADQWEAEELVCRLVRPDGSRWTVRGIRQEEGGVRVDAVRTGGDDPQGRAGEPPDPREAGDALRGEPLARGDRIEWWDPAGELVWALKPPLGYDEARG